MKKILLMLILIFLLLGCQSEEFEHRYITQTRLIIILKGNTTVERIWTQLDKEKPKGWPKEFDK